MQHRKLTLLLVFVLSLWLRVGQPAEAATLGITSHTYPETVVNVPWGLPVDFAVTDGVPFPDGTTFSFDFGDGHTLDTVDPFVSHLYTYAGVPAACVPVAVGQNPPDVCIDPGMIR